MNTKREDAVAMLEKRILKAVSFVPQDEGKDKVTEVTVSLSDLRELVGASWEGQELARDTTREVIQGEKVIQEYANQLKVLRRRLDKKMP